jgi:hypothetical protein
MKFIELIRGRESPKKEEPEVLRKLLGKTAIEQFEGSLLLELRQETLSRVWKLFESKRKAAKKLREEYQIIDQPDDMYGLFPIEAFLFELYLTGRLLKREGLVASRSLRIDFRTGDAWALSKSQSRLKKPEEVHRREKEIEDAISLAEKAGWLILGEYASEIETDPEGSEFQAWALLFERLAQQFTVLYFDDDKSRIQGAVAFKKTDIVNKRRAMLQQDL